MEIFPDELYFETTKDKIERSLSDYTSLAFSFLLILVLSRLLEFCLLGFTKKLTAGGFGFLFPALVFDVKLWLFMSAWLLFPCIPIMLINKRLGNVLFYAVFGVLILIYLNLIFYFSVTMNPLGADVLAYSWADIKTTVKASGALSYKNILPGLLIISGVFFLLKKLPQIRIKKIMGYAFLIVCVLSIITIRMQALIPKASNFKKERDFYLVSNKLGYFVANIYNHFAKENIVSVKENSEAANIPREDKTGFEYVSNDFPFLRKDQGEDVLGSFIQSDSVKPDFVFLVIEGLGRSFSGPNAGHGSFTPFLDSLSTKSLYWENFMSTAGRTFAVLPSLFASLPFSKNGYNESNMPDHLSLPSVLKKNGYRTSFYYGGDASFDNMRKFMEKQKTDNIFDSHTFDKSYSRLPGNAEGFSWGYSDFDLYDKAVKTIKNVSGPALDIILTVSTHSPFLIPNQEKYKAQAKEKYNALGLTNDDKEEHLNYLKQYSTILYADDALRTFFRNYATLPKYQHTIFIITGDHQLPEIPINTQTERFHVPLIIFSPLLKTTASFKGVCSQFDVTPSILNFMNKNYNLPMPSVCHWLGSGLDTSLTFRSVKNYPLMRNKNELVDYISTGYMYAQGELYSLSENLNIDPIPDDQKTAQVALQFQDFKTRNASAFNKKSLIPDSLLKYK